MSQFRKNIVKLYFSIKGFLNIIKFKKSNRYYSAVIDAAAIYRGKKIFFTSLQAIEPTTGVVFFDSRENIYPYWKIGLYNFKKMNDE